MRGRGRAERISTVEGGTGRTGELVDHECRHNLRVHERGHVVVDEGGAVDEDVGEEVEEVAAAKGGGVRGGEG